MVRQYAPLSRSPAAAAGGTENIGENPLHARAGRSQTKWDFDASAVQPPGTTFANSAGIFGSGCPAAAPLDVPNCSGAQIKA